MYLDIALWRRGPQDLPAVGILLPLTIAAYMFISVALGEALPALRAGWAPQVLADTAFVALWYWALLALARRRERYLQTAWLLQRFAHNPPWLAVSYVCAILVLVWTVAAIGHVLRAALERSLTFCVILAFTQMLVEELLFLAVFSTRH